MGTLLNFTKVHGLGNDFVLLDVAGSQPRITAAAARALCDRHRGVGADGVLSILPGDRHPFRMHLYNADGSEAEMCGNGIRCVVKYLLDRGRAPGDEVVIETGGGPLACTATRGADGKVETVRVDMGAPMLEMRDIPMSGGLGRFLDGEITAAGERIRLSAVSMGNPHAVILGSVDRARAARLGPAIENHERFPNRTNVEFLNVRSAGEADLLVWERGSGFTQACGTGACAAAVAGYLAGRIDAGREVLIRLPGGDLYIEVEPDLSRVWMRGPAAEVFTGSIEV